jgi:NAD(P)-dependent dehydrogenase (short-subunit alcohol dehydrogenase family)
MNLNLNEKVIIVTGGASGIGESICKKLAEEGAIPCILDKNEKNMERVVSEIKKKYLIDAFSAFTELTDPSACSISIDKILSKFGRIDGLVNNAGINDGVSLENGNYEKFIDSINKNVGHYFTISQFVLPALKKSLGSIVNICSKTAITGQGGTSGYAAANGARISLSKEWANDLLPFGINVNAVIVAECWTPQYEQWINQNPNPAEKLRQIKNLIPLGNRLTTPDEVADTVLLLLSPNSKCLNGQLFFVDGGYTFLDRSINKI